MSKSTIATTGIKAESYEHGLDHLLKYAANVQPDTRFNYALLMEEEDGSYNMVERNSMPCWGALREYNTGTRPEDPWPGDLREPRHIFPATGNPVALSIQFPWWSYYPRISNDDWNQYITGFAYNQAVSPWKNVIKDVEFAIKDDRITGIVFKDCKVDPTVLVHLLRVTSRPYQIDEKIDMYRYEQHVDHPAIAFLMRMYAPRIEVERFVDGNPYDFSNGGTLYSRESYNRPDIDYIFGGKNNSGILRSRMSIDELIRHYHDVKNGQQEQVA